MGLAVDRSRDLSEIRAAPIFHGEARNERPAPERNDEDAVDLRAQGRGEEELSAMITRDGFDDSTPLHIHSSHSWVALSIADSDECSVLVERTTDLAP